MTAAQDHAIAAALDAARAARSLDRLLERNQYGHATREEVESAWSRLEAAMQLWRRG